VLEENEKENNKHKDEYDESDDVDDDENLDHVELDMSTPNFMHTKESFQNRSNKNMTSPGRRGRIVMSHLVKAAI
jgi:hypothetical protein